MLSRRPASAKARRVGDAASRAVGSWGI